MKRFFAFLLALLVLFQSGEAQAIQYKGKSAYLVAGKVHLDGMASTKSTVDYGSVNTTVSRTAGTCGQISFSPKVIAASPTIKIGSKSFNIGTISAAAPKCNKGSFTPATTTPFMTKKGSVSIPGFSPKTKVAVILNRDYTHKIRFNKCGTATFGATKSHPLPSTFSYNGTSYNVSALATAPAAAKCSVLGVSAPPKGSVASDWGLSTSSAMLVDQNWVEDTSADVDDNADDEAQFADDGSEDDSEDDTEQTQQAESDDA